MPQSLTNLEIKLNTALRHALYTSVGGSTNKIESIEKSGGWVLNFSPRYYGPGQYLKESTQFTSVDHTANVSFNPYLRCLFFRAKKWYYHPKETKKNPDTQLLRIDHEYDFNEIQKRFNINQTHIDLVLKIIMADEMRVNNCGWLAALVANYLWKNHEGIHRIEIFTARTFDHAWVVVNRAENSQADNSDSWGENCWCIDAWYKEGIIYKATNFKEQIIKIRDYVELQHQELKKIGLKVDQDIPTHNSQIQCEIKPDINEYPSLLTGYEHFLINRYFPLLPLNPKPEDDPYAFLGKCDLELTEKSQAFRKQINEGEWKLADKKIRDSFLKENETEPHKIQKAFIKACLKGDRHEALRIINLGLVDINANYNGSTPLFLACRSGNSDIAKLLIEKQADVNLARKMDGKTPLHVTFENEHFELFALLLNFGADIDQVQTTSNQPLLHTACEWGNVRAATFLLEHKANANLENADGKSPLAIACGNSQIEMVNLLLLFADVNQKSSKNGETALFTAERQ
jgi:hypothetical protein